MKRIFWIVLDSAGIGEAPDADKFGDIGSNTWKSCYDSGKLHIPNMEKIGIYQIDGMEYAKAQRIRPEVLQECRNYPVERIRRPDTGKWRVS